jgi:hypothetical protein
MEMPGFLHELFQPVWLLFLDGSFLTFPLALMKPFSPETQRDFAVFDAVASQFLKYSETVILSKIKQFLQ